MVNKQQITQDCENLKLQNTQPGKNTRYWTNRLHLQASIAAFFQPRDWSYTPDRGDTLGKGKMGHHEIHPSSRLNPEMGSGHIDTDSDADTYMEYLFCKVSFFLAYGENTSKIVRISKVCPKRNSRGKRNLQLLSHLFEFPF